jgi:hypothetical protein
MYLDTQYVYMHSKAIYVEKPKHLIIYEWREY